MENNTIVKRIFIGVLLLVVIVAVAALVISKVIYKKSVTPAEQPNQTQSDIVKTEVDKTKDPEKFPAGVPIEEGAVVTQNYNAEATDGRYQATKVFETQKTLADNFNIYRDYMRQNGWDIKSTVNQEN